MGLEVFANNYATTLNGAINSSVTSVVVATAPTGLLASASAIQWRLLVDSELMLVTGVSGSTLTVTRGIEGTTAASHGNGAVATHILTSVALQRVAVNPGVSEARISLSSSNAVSTADITDVATLYLQPYKGNRVALYNGSEWGYYLVDSGGSVPSASLAGASGTVKDVFASISGVAIALSFVSWTNTTTRATALTTQDGIWVLSTDTTKRYLGTVYFDALNGVSDSIAMRGCWNYYNQRRRKLARAETADNWTYAGTTFHQANANSANQVGVVVGLGEVPVEMRLIAHGDLANGSVVQIGRDGTTVIADQMADSKVAGSGLTIAVQPMHASVLDYPTPGFHTYTWLENTLGAGTSTFYGTAAAGTYRSGLLGSVEG